MLKVIRVSVILSVLASGIVLTVGSCVAVEAETSKPALISKELLDHSQLELVWSQKLPMTMKKNESMSRMFIAGESVYALSNYNYLVGLDMNIGRIKFSKAVAEKGLPVEKIGYFQGSLISVVGNKLVEMDPESGDVLKSSIWKLGLTCPVVRDEYFYYLGAPDNRVHVLQAGNRVQVFELAAESDTAITSVITDDELTIFSTVAGDVICVRSGSTTKLWSFNASDSVIGPMVKKGDRVIFASKDTNVYCLDIARKGELLWKYQTAAILDKAPNVTNNTVYQYVCGKGLIALDAENGKLLWELDGGLNLLSESGSKSYVITDSGKLAVIDKKKQKLVYSANLSGVTLHAVNVEDSKIYIGDKTGRVMCLKPVE